MARWIDIDNPHGPMRAWRAEPAGPAHGAVLVIQEIFGVNAHIRSVAEKVAAAGFVALAPALFDPLEPGIELGYDERGIDTGRELTVALGFERAVELLDATAEVLQEEGLRSGAVGFCWGGTLALLANTRLGLPAVSYYGGRSVPFLDEPLRAPMLFHFGERDPIIPPGHVALHRQKHPEAALHVYPAGHGFACEARGDFEPASAALAWERTTRFLLENLR